MDGILFIDEAYSLVGEGNDDYGKEAVAALIKRMEDDRDRLVVIVAGYSDEMKKFIDSNPGFKSRFNRYIHFPDYDSPQLMEIFQLMCTNADYTISGEAKQTLSKTFNELYQGRDKDFGNGRLVRNAFERTIENLCNRIAAAKSISKDDLTVIQSQDIPAISFFLN